MLVHEGVTRTPEADRKLGLSLAAVAGALGLPLVPHEAVDDADPPEPAEQLDAAEA